MRNVSVVVALFAASGCVIVVPEVAKQYNFQCVDALAAGDLDQADVLCDHALEYQSEYWDALNNKGLIALRRGNEKAAKRFFIHAIRANNSMAQAYVNLCQMALDKADFMNARDNCLAALRINPDFGEARHNLGLAYLRLNRLDDAEKTFRHLVASAPGVSQGYANVGAVMLAKHKPTEALGWFDQALLLEAGYADAWKGRGFALETLGHREEALTAYASCAEFAPGDLECRQGLTRLAE